MNTTLLVLTIVFGLTSAITVPICIVKLGFRADDRFDALKERAGKIAAWASRKRLHLIERFCLEISQWDLTDAVGVAGLAIDRIEDPKIEPTLLDDCGWQWFQDKLDTPDWLAKFTAKVDERRRTNGTQQVKAVVTPADK